MAIGESLLPVSANDDVERQPDWRQLILVCYLPSALCFFNYGIGLLGIPLICKHWGIPVATVAYLKTVAEAAETAFSIPASHAAILFASKGTVLIGCAAYTLSSLALAQVPSFSLLALGYFFQSGSVKVFNRGRSLIMKDVPKRFYGRTNGHLIFIRCVFLSIAPVVLRVALDVIGSPVNIFNLQALLGLVMIVLVCAHCDGLHSALNSKAAAGKTAEDSATPPVKTLVTYREMVSGECGCVLARTVGLCSCISMLIGGYNILLPVVSLTLEIPVAQIAAAMTLCFGLAGAFSIMGGTLVDKLGRKVAMMFAMILFAVGHAVLGILTLAKNHHHFAILLTSGAILGIAESTAAPLRGVLKNDNADFVKKWAREHGHDENSAVAKSFGLLDVLLDIVGIFYPILLGLSATYISTTVTSFTFCSLGVVATFWAACLPSNF